MTTYKLTIINGQFATEPILTKDEWINILHASDNSQHRKQIEALRMFLYQPGHKATCSRIGKEYTISPASVNSLIVHFCIFAQKSSKKEFRIEDSDSETESYWPLAMLGRHVKGNLFEWELRPELVDALQSFLLERIIKVYRTPIIEEGLDNSRSKELYKWRLLASIKGKSPEEILHLMATRHNENNILTWRTKDAIKKALTDNKNELIHCFSLLENKTLEFSDRFNQFVEYGKSFLPKTAAERILKEKEACFYLACIDPADNPIYKWTLYRDTCAYLGIDSQNDKPVEQYLAILKTIVSLESKDDELISKLKEETAPFFWSELLNAQDVLYQTQDYIRGNRPKNWLQLIYDDAIARGDGAFTWWYPRYSESVKLFLDMFTPDKSAEDISEDNIDYFIRAQNNNVCNNGQGCFTHAEYPKLRQLWSEIYNILKRNVESGEVSSDDFVSLEKLIRPALNNNHPVAYHRLWSALFPERLTTCCKDTDFYYAYNTVRALDDSLKASSGNWLKDNLALMSYLEDKVRFNEPWHRAIFARFLYDNLSAEDNNTDMKQYTDLLSANKNLVLTGAPGTGKTYLAKQIACQMILGKNYNDSLSDEEKVFFNDHCKLVQFHPSYDYSDFVEGLRPVKEDKNQIGFKRQNGVLKDICEKAIQNLEESGKSKEEQKVEKDARQRSLDFLNNAIGDNRELYTKTKKPFTITQLEDTAFFVCALEVSESLIRVPLKDLYFLLGNTRPEKVTDIKDIVGRKRTQQYDSYLFSILECIDKEASVMESELVSSGNETVRKENFVLIIDEINRGELSKIFGELFFSIDPGYRGISGRVQTQYQNLVEEDDVFYNGFYVPENVYIIGTMNDIDRGVESMDFAIRRRFAWLEIKAEDRISMWDDRIPDWMDSAKRCMVSLNEALEKKEIGLSPAYHIGPAYFLKLSEYDGEFEKLWEYHIKGILTEYLRGSRGIPEKMAALKEAFDKYKEQ